MARAPRDPNGEDGAAGSAGAGAYDEMLLAAMERGDETLQTGRYIVTYEPGATEQAGAYLESLGVRAADARDYAGQEVSAADVGDADALVLPEIGVAIMTGPAAQEREASLMEAVASPEVPVAAMEPEYFVFADQLSSDFVRGFRRAVEALTQEAGPGAQLYEEDIEVDAQVSGATWGLAACRVPQSSRSGAGIRVAVLDTGMALNHPDFTGRPITSQTFVGQPVQDLNGHGTHCVGTACGPKAPPGTTPRYGIAYQSPIFVGKVLTNAGNGGSGGVLAGMNWAIANQCAVISMSLGSQSPPQAAYTAAGQAALAKGLLIVAAAGNMAMPTGSPANSPTIMSVASLDPNLSPSSFSNFGKIEIAAPGRDVFSSVPMPQRYGVKSGTSMATPHVAGCAALWAQTSPALRGQALWNRLLATAKPLPFPPTRVGRGLVQAPA